MVFFLSTFEREFRLFSINVAIAHQTNTSLHNGQLFSLNALLSPYNSLADLIRWSSNSPIRLRYTVLCTVLYSISWKIRVTYRELHAKDLVRNTAGWRTVLNVREKGHPQSAVGGGRQYENFLGDAHCLKGLELSIAMSRVN